MRTLWVLIVGVVVGAIAGALTNGGRSMGWIANTTAGLVGLFIGEKILGSWGLHVADMTIVPSITEAVVLVAVISFFFGRKNS